MKIIRKRYMGGSFSFPPLITQRFWDEVTQRREEFEEWNKNNPDWPRVDTSYGSDDLGERPSLPDWVYTIGWILFCFISFACTIFMALVFYRGY